MIEKEAVHCGTWAVKFGPSDGLGMDILLNYGAVRSFPDCIYTCPSRQVISALPVLFRLNVEFEINPDIPFRLTLKEARSLISREGWGRLELIKPYELDRTQFARKVRDFMEDWPVVPLTGKDLQVLNRYPWRF